MNEQALEDQFRTLTEFLDRFGSGAVGHAREELTAEQQELLRRLAAGELDDSTRSAAFAVDVQIGVFQQLLRAE